MIHAVALRFPAAVALFVMEVAAALSLHAQVPSPAAPAQATAGKDGWVEVDQRLVFLAIQLSTVESSIAATDKALKAAGYQKIAREAAAEEARQKNELMDRRGGGPVPWQDFYGRTAERFFYRPKDGLPLPIAQRPPQFDFIYRANDEARLKAEGEAAKIGDKIEDLLAFRRQLENEQAALWCRIAFRGCSSMELSARPLYRLGPAGSAADEAGKQKIEAAKAAIAFMRAVDAELALAQKSVDDQKAMIDHLVSTTASARGEMQGKLLGLPVLTAALANPRDPLGQFSRAARRLEDCAQNLADAYRLEAESDARGDLAGKRTYRGQFQQSASDYAATVVAADQALTAAAMDWKLAPAAVVTRPADPPPTPTTVATGADTIAGRLDAAKAAHQKELADARRAFVAAIDARLNAAADAGDLRAVQALQTAKIKAAHDGSVAETTADEAVISAKKTMDQSIGASSARLAAAYREAVAGYTKARRITEAAAIQDEFDASGLAALPATGGTGVTPEIPPTTVIRTTPPVTSPDGAFPPPNLPDGRLEVEIPAPIDEVAVGGGGRYLVLNLKKLRQLAIFDVSQAKVLKYLPMPSTDLVFAAGAKKLYVGIKDLKRIQRYDLATQALELTVPAPEGGIGAIAIGAASLGPVVMIGDNSKRFWLVNAATLKAEPYPSKNWGTPGSAWGPTNIHVSFDGTTAVVCGGGWAGIELSTLSATKVNSVRAGSYVNGDTLVSGNGALVFPNEGGILRSDLTSKVSGIDGKPFPAVDPAFSLAFQKDRGSKSKPSLVLFANGDPRPLVTLRDLPELAQDSKLPLWQRIHLIPRGNVLVTVGEGADHLVLRKFDLAHELEAEGIDYLFVESAPVTQASRGGRYSYKMQIKSKKGGVKVELQSGPKGMTVSKDGLVQWSIPTRPAEERAAVIIQISDASGQTIFHSFEIDLTETATRR